MPEEPEVETQELQETLDELQEERKEREAAEKRTAWTRYIALTTAFLAVFAAIGAMQSGALVNEAMVEQIKAADKWNEYQAARLKDHTYTIAANGLVDSGAALPAGPASESASATESRPTGGHAAHGKPSDESVKAGRHGKQAASGTEKKKKPAALKAMAPAARLAFYAKQIQHESEKEESLSEEAKKFEEESEHRMHLHHGFALSVAFIQVAIALSAVAALTRMKVVWAGSIAIGLVGIWYFAQGFIAK